MWNLKYISLRKLDVSHLNGFEKAVAILKPLKIKALTENRMRVLLIAFSSYFEKTPSLFFIFTGYEESMGTNDCYSHCYEYVLGYMKTLATDRSTYA